MAEKSERINVSVDKELYNEIWEEAHRRSSPDENVSMSKVAREVLEEKFLNDPDDSDEGNRKTVATATAD